MEILNVLEMNPLISDEFSTTVIRHGQGGGAKTYFLLKDLLSCNCVLWLLYCVNSYKGNWKKWTTTSFCQNINERVTVIWMIYVIWYDIRYSYLNRIFFWIQTSWSWLCPTRARGFKVYSFLLYRQELMSNRRLVKWWALAKYLLNLRVEV